MRISRWPTAAFLAYIIALMHGYWQRRFAGDAGVIGRAVTIDAQPRTVIGVMPADFTFLDLKADILLPQRSDRARTNLGNFSYNGVARADDRGAAGELSARTTRGGAESRWGVASRVSATRRAQASAGARFDAAG